MNKLTDLGIPYVYFEMVDFDILNKLYNSLDLYIVSSRVEGGPQAILECAITKTPIISTDVGVASEILSPNSIYELNNPLSAVPDVEFAFKQSKKYCYSQWHNLFKDMLKSFMKVSIGSKIVLGPWGGGNYLQSTCPTSY